MSCGYDYYVLQDTLETKLNNLLFVKADKRIESDGKESFFFNYAEIYTRPSFNSFLSLLDSGDIMYDIRMGTYCSGRMYGRPHDHGSGFRIRESKLVRLYEDFEIL